MLAKKPKIMSVIQLKRSGNVALCNDYSKTKIYFNFSPSYSQGYLLHHVWSGAENPSYFKMILALTC